MDRVGSVTGRLSRAWRQLPHERRLAALAAIGLVVALFLPWYQETVIARGVTNLRSLSDSVTGWGAFSFVEAAVLLVAGGVLALLFVRAEDRAFHVPGGDGGVVTAAGVWTCLLIIWRMFDKEGTTGHGLYTTTSGIEWGIFVALAVAGLLTYAGSRIRLAHEPEPPLPGELPRGRRMRGRRRGQRASGAGEERSDAIARDGAAESASPASRGARLAELDMDQTWIQVERSSPPAPRADTPPARRARRPRSLAEPPADRDGPADDGPSDRPSDRPSDPPSDPRPEDQLTLRLNRPD